MSGPALLSVDLSALAENYRILRARFTGSMAAAVVKANAYGLGVADVARRLSQEGCPFFFVATLSEGAQLRHALPEAEIAVFAGPWAGEERAYLRHRLLPVLNDPGQIARWKDAAAGERRTLGCILQTDSGMHRLGLSSAEQQALLDDPSRLEGLEVRVVMSHLACTEAPDHPQNARQLAAFRRSLALAPQAKASLSNSAAVFMDAAYHFDVARPGCALYGINPTAGANPMRPVVRLDAPILSVRGVDAQGAVGYGATWLAASPARIATVALGYADGYLRSAGNRAAARIGEFAVPVIGRISMDLITLDVTAVPPPLCIPGTMVSFLNERYTVDDLARDSGTIGYEILTRLGSRFTRIYA